MSPDRHDLGRRPVALLILLLVLPLALILSLAVGSYPVSPAQALWVLLAWGKGLQEPVVAVVWLIRLPRALLAGMVGSALALAGVGFQAISRNPLADPTVLGVSSGATFGVLIALLLGVGGPFGDPVVITLFAFGGALLAALSVYTLAQVEGRLPVTTLLLSGVIVGLFFTSCVMLLTALLAPPEFQGVLFWLMGNLGPVNGRILLVLAGVLALGAVAIHRQSARLNLLALGEEQALQLGVEAERVKRVIFVAASLVTGAAISAAGSIGFVGLVVPHAARFLLGADNRRIVPASAILGAAFLMLADLVARTVAAPMELPVGVVTSFCGAPLFMYLLRRRRGAEV